MELLPSPSPEELCSPPDFTETCPPEASLPLWPSRVAALSFPHISCSLGMDRRCHPGILFSFEIITPQTGCLRKQQQRLASEGGALQFSHPHLLSTAVWVIFPHSLSIDTWLSVFFFVTNPFHLPDALSVRMEDLPTSMALVSNLLLSKDLLPPLRHLPPWSHLGPSNPRTCCASETTSATLLLAGPLLLPACLVGCPCRGCALTLLQCLIYWPCYFLPIPQPLFPF